MSNELPPLPDSEYSLAFYDEGGIHEAHGDAFTADQMRDYARAAVLQERERSYSLVLESPYRARKGASWKSIAFDVLTRIRDGECPHIPPAAPQTIEPRSTQGVPHE